MLKNWNIIYYKQTETALNMPFWFILFYRKNYVKFLIERRWPRPNRLCRSAPPASRKLKKLIRAKIPLGGNFFRRRNISIVSNAIRYNLFSFWALVMEGFYKVYCSAYHSNPLCTRNTNLAMNFFFSVTCRNQQIKTILRRSIDLMKSKNCNY